MVVAAKVKQEADLNTLVKLYLLRCDVEGKSPFTVVAYRETLR